MKNPIQFIQASTPVRNSIDRSLRRRGFSRIKLAVGIACFAFLSMARAVTPPPDGGYPNGNTAEGTDALFHLTSDGIQNTAVGFQALANATIAFGNTATGYSALHGNTFGDSNTATGSVTLFRNTTGNNNTANGGGALANNTTGSQNTAVGLNSLLGNTTGDNNTAVGTDVLFFNCGSGNTAMGDEALDNSTTGNNNIALGRLAGANLTTGDNNIEIGAEGNAGESNTIRIGTDGTQTATFVAGIRGVPIAGGVAVGVDPNGQLGVRPSSARFKDGIRQMDKASEAILSLKPVSFRYKKEFDPRGLPQFGLIAEEVALIDPDLVVSDEKGKPFSVRYEEVNAMLLNEFLKEHRKVEMQDRRVKKQDTSIADLKITLAQQQQEIGALTATLREQAAQIQKVNAQLEMNKTAPRLVMSDH